MAELKTFEYTGMNLAIPQSLAQMGSCQEIINARRRKGCWRPIGEKVPFTINGSPVDIPEIIDEVYLHDIENGFIPGEPNWIGYDISTGIVYLLDPTDTDATTGTPITTITDKENVSITFLKRTMIICSGDGVQVFLYNSETSPYYFLTADLPVPDVDLSIFDSLEVTTEHVELTTFKDVADSALGYYFKTLNDESQLNGRLFGSIMYITAYRLFDGSYILPSIPRYFQINNGGSMTFINGNGTTNYAANFKFTLSKLKSTINNELYPSSIGESKALIDSICVFATRVTPLHLIDESTVTESFIHKNIPPNGGSTVEVSKYFKDIFPINPEFSKLAASPSWFKIMEFNFEDVVGKTGKTTKDVDVKGFYQDYATRQTLTSDQFTHHSLSARSATVYNDRLHLLNIKTTLGKPYIQWDDTSEDIAINGYIDGSVIVWTKTGNGPGIVIKDLQIPLYVESTEIIESFLSYLQASIFIDTLTEDQKSTAFINETINDFGAGGIVTEYDVHYKTFTGSIQSIKIPSVIGYNDVRAYKIQIVVDGKIALSESLIKNSLMNFAYYHSTVFSPDESKADANYKPISKELSTLSFPSEVITEKELPFDTNRLQVSEIQNPLIFPAKYSYQIGTGDGITMAAGSEPLSTGQFGQFPLQVFTTKGIWALEIGLGDILYTNVLTVNAEVIENRKNVISVGSGVVYSTHNGLFLLNGRQSTELGEIVEGLPVISPLISEIQTLIDPGVTNIHFTKGLSETLSSVNFLTYLLESSIGFDYDNRELIVTNSNYHYSYIYSFESQLWFKLSKSFTKLINHYPKLLGVTSDSILSISQESLSQEVQVMFITNAQSFESPDSYKKIERLIQRIKFGSDYQKVTGIYLFASDDLVTWQLMVGRQKEGSYIKDLVVQRSHGSARHYVIVLNGTMKPDSEIKQIELLVKIKLNNRLR